MKKFLPLIIFAIVFATVLAGQVALKMVNNIGDVDKNPEYQHYEELYLHANYKTIDGKDLQMTKLTAPVVIYNFWASWCIPCLEEMPSMIALKKKFKPDQVQIIAINTDEDDQMANIQKTMKKINMTDEFTIVADKEAKLIDTYKISAIPVTMVFHRGKVVHFSNGPMDFNSEEFQGKMEKWVND